MTRPVRLPLALLASALLWSGGCLRGEYETTLYPDGSGKMVVHVAIRQSLIQEARRQAGRPGELPTEELNGLLAQIQKPENLKDYVAGIVGWKPIRVEEDATWLRGVYTVYFDDINQLQVTSKKQVVFSWRLISSGGTQTLYQMTGMRGLPALKVAPGDQAQATGMAERVRPLLEEFRVSLQVTVPGPIKESKGVLNVSGRSAGWQMDGAMFLGALRNLEGSEMKRIRDIMDVAESRISWSESAVTPAETEAWKKELAAAKEEWRRMGGAGMSDNELERTFIRAKLDVATAHLNAGRKEQARKILEDVIQEYPNHRETLAAKALLEKAR